MSIDERRAADHHLADDHRVDAGGDEAIGDALVDGLGEERPLAGRHDDQHGSLLAHRGGDQRQHLRDHRRQVAPRTAGGDQDRVPAVDRLGERGDRLRVDGGAVVQRAVDVDGDDHRLHVPSIRRV